MVGGGYSRRCQIPSFVRSLQQRSFLVVTIVNLLVTPCNSFGVMTRRKSTWQGGGGDVSQETIATRRMMLRPSLESKSFHKRHPHKLSTTTQLYSLVLNETSTEAGLPLPLSLAPPAFGGLSELLQQQPDTSGHHNNRDNHDLNEEQQDDERAWLAARMRSVNYHISRNCNYSCKFCFHTQKVSK